MTVVPDGNTAPYGCVTVVEVGLRVVVVTVGSAVVTVGLSVVVSVGRFAEVGAVVGADEG